MLSLDFRTVIHCSSRKGYPSDTVKIYSHINRKSIFFFLLSLKDADENNFIGIPLFDLKILEHCAQVTGEKFMFSCFDAIHECELEAEKEISITKRIYRVRLSEKVSNRPTCIGLFSNKQDCNKIAKQ